MPDDILFDTLQGFTFAQDKALTVVVLPHTELSGTLCRMQVLRFVLRAGANVLHQDDATGACTGCCYTGSELMGWQATHHCMRASVTADMH